MGVDDKGNVHRFETGAVRSTDADDYRYDLITPIGLAAVARTYAEGAKKYGDHNWLKGMPVSDLLNHAMKHIDDFRGGDRSEDHLGHAAWGLLAAIHSHVMWPHLNGNLLGPGCTPPGDKAEKPVEKSKEKTGAPPDFDTLYADFLARHHLVGSYSQKEYARILWDFPSPKARKLTGIPLIDDFRALTPGDRDPTAAPVLYLSGPMSGLTLFNFPAFKAAAKNLRQLGYNVLDPSDFGANPGETWKSCLTRDIGCLANAQVMVMLPGWEHSKGACLERSTAIGLGAGVLLLTDILD